MTKKPMSVAMLLAAVAAAGCSTRVVEITEPARAAPIVAPVTTYKLKFDPAYVPNTFSAQLNGKDVSGNVMPAATPGGVTTLWMWDRFEDAFDGGTPEPGKGATYVPGPYYIPSGGGSGTPPSKVAVPSPFPASGATGKAPDCPVPNFTWYQQKLAVSAACSARFCDTNDELDFYPVHVVATPRVKEIPLHGRVGAVVQAFPAITAPLTVRLRPTNGTVSVNGQPAGAAAFVTIMPGSCMTDFTITGMSRGGMMVFVEAAGIMRSTVSGSVY